jgi:hypothetical protein
VFFLGKQERRIGTERYEQFPVFYLFFEFFVISVFVCHFVYLATSSEDLKIMMIDLI